MILWQLEEAGWLVDFLYPTRLVTLYDTMWNQMTQWYTMHPGPGPDLQDRWYFYAYSLPTGQLCSPSAEQITFKFPSCQFNDNLVHLVNLGKTFGSRIGILSRRVYQLFNNVNLCLSIFMLITLSIWATHWQQASRFEAADFDEPAGGKPRV